MTLRSLGFVYMFFTCCSRDDSLRVEVSEEQAVDQGGFSKPRFTFWQREEDETIVSQHQN